MRWHALLALPLVLLGSAWLLVGPGLPVSVTVHLEPRRAGPPPPPGQRQTVAVQPLEGAAQLRLPGLLVVGQPTVVRGTVGQAFTASQLALGDAGRFDRYGLLAGTAGSQGCMAFTPLHADLRVTALGGLLDEAGRLDLSVESGAGTAGCERPRPRAGTVISVHP